MARRVVGDTMTHPLVSLPRRLMLCGRRGQQPRWALPFSSARSRALPCRCFCSGDAVRTWRERQWADMRDRGSVEAVTHDDVSQHLTRTDAPVRFYVGFDPTASSLHLGSLAQLVAVKRLQRLGHQPVILIGGGTGRIGDPSGRSTERFMLNADTLDANVAGIRADVKRVLQPSNQDTHEWDANACGSPPVSCAMRDPEFVDNASWYDNMDALTFVAGIGRHFRLGPMLSRETVRARMESDDGMSFTEFTYALFQAYDFYHLWRHHGVTLQLGGSDQWGNIVAGCDLIRRMTSSEVAERKGKSSDTAPCFGVTLPLLTTADGRKIGKSTGGGGGTWLAPEKTSPLQLYQSLVNTADADVGTLLRYLTMLPVPSVDHLLRQHSQRPEDREAQHTLAKHVVATVHGRQAAVHAVEATRLWWGAKRMRSPLPRSVPLAAVAALPRIALPASDVLGQPVAVVMKACGLVESRADATRCIKSGAVRLNEVVVGSAAQRVPQGSDQQATPQTMSPFQVEGEHGTSAVILRVGKGTPVLVCF